MRWKRLLLKSEDSILTALGVINAGGERFALIVSDNQRLLGVVTDGNIRRGLLDGKTLQEPVSAVMQSEPVTAFSSESRRSVTKRLKAADFSHMPVLNEEGILVDLWSLKELRNDTAYVNPVVLMAGGLGSRLGELTRNCPKPMLHVGGRPILEIVLHNFTDCGFSRFFISVNYKAEQIESYFGSGEKWGVEITYLRESEPLGTAGALSLLPTDIGAPAIVMNGDILTRIKADALIDAHEESGAAATMVIKEHEFHIPYGVIEYSETREVTGLREKPHVAFPVSAGINVLSPETLETIPGNTRLDMPTVFQMLLEQGKRIHTFQLDDYWLDIGRISDYEKANDEYLRIFSSGLS